MINRVANKPLAKPDIARSSAFAVLVPRQRWFSFLRGSGVGCALCQRNVALHVRSEGMGPALGVHVI